MVFKHFRWGITWRVLVLSLESLALMYSLSDNSLIFTSILIGVLMIIQIINLINYAEQMNRDLVDFFESVKYSDFTKNFKRKGKGSSFNEVYEAWDEVVGHFNEIRREKEEHRRYLQMVVEHVGIGLIVFRKDGQVEMINKAGKELLNCIAIRNIDSLPGEISELLDELKTGQRKMHVFQSEDYDDRYLSFFATEFKRKGQLYKLVSIQNIRQELEDKETEAWQDLTRVLTHEIMNSITPISSLSGTINQLLNNGSKDTYSDDETMEDIKEGVQTIHKRSEGLIQFVNDYRDFTKLQKPNLKNIPVQDLLNRVYNLMQKTYEEQGITLKNEWYSSKEIMVDDMLLEQVLINLLKNAMEAVRDVEKPEVTLKCWEDFYANLHISVTDNGAGINKDEMNKIFIPFYSTKKDGSGIGLSLSRQIMHLHGGSITAQSEPGKNTTFMLTLKS
ncbi:MAG TPA: HAMP domain-containing sensor histidine kinase [Balneolales bacterium]|nr:HAMP domain-containing sensor histidine kinase [Balneolales bacterium]